jgi:hypothetical protein
MVECGKELRSGPALSYYVHNITSIKIIRPSKLSISMDYQLEPYVHILVPRTTEMDSVS